jgi:hypothetical protein
MQLTFLGRNMGIDGKRENRVNQKKGNLNPSKIILKVTILTRDNTSLLGELNLFTGGSVMKDHLSLVNPDHQVIHNTNLELFVQRTNIVKIVMLLPSLWCKLRPQSQQI